MGGVAVRAEAPGVPFGRELIGRRMPAAQCTRSCLGRGHRRGARCLLGRAAFLFPATCSPPPWEIWPSSQMAPGPRSWKSRRIPEVPESGRRRRPSQLRAPRRRCGCVVPALAPSPGRARGRGWPSGAAATRMRASVGGAPVRARPSRCSASFRWGHCTTMCDHVCFARSPSPSPPPAAPGPAPA